MKKQKLLLASKKPTSETKIKNKPITKKAEIIPPAVSDTDAVRAYKEGLFNNSDTEKA